MLKPRIFFRKSTYSNSEIKSEKIVKSQINKNTNSKIDNKPLIVIDYQRLFNVDEWSQN